MKLLSKDNGRFVFQNSTVDRSITEMCKTVEILAELNPEVKIVVTVSPVPMNTTFTAQDVLVANTYSKSTLRVVAQHLCDNYEYVDYFPSYEMVVYSPREAAYAADYLHIRGPMVKSIVSHFIANYIE